ncbi:MAG: neutral/alkaline non-lysosomal ceramidase N-terminal domain-containing protein [Bryobacteraceae bacterium]
MVYGLAAALVFAGCVLAQKAPARNLRAGAAKADITPKPSELPVSTDSIRDHLFARAIVVDDGSTCAVLVGLDMGGASNPIVDDAIPRASKSSGCPVQNFIVSATHTHSSNTLGLGGQGAPTAKTVADAIVEAVNSAKSKLAPARVGYGTTQVDLNVNRDLFNSKLEWRQEPNPTGPSDKTLAVVEFLGNDNVPIGVYMNYAMHPINFYLSGVISADFPGEASRYVEDLFDNHTVAIFSQGASGDQNPRDFRSPTTFMGERAALVTEGHGPIVQSVGSAPAPADQAAPKGFNPQQASSERKPIPAGNLEDYKKVLARTGDYVHMLGAVIGSSTVRVMRESIQPVDTARIWGEQEGISCPGRVRLDAANPARENVFPGYKEGPDVNMKVGVLRIGDINFVAVNGEVYSQIAMKLKANAPAAKSIVVTLANGMANSGYIYSDEAYSHLTFQVIGSRLKPGCAERKIVGTAIDLMHRSGE